MNYTITSSTGRYGIKATVTMNGNQEGKVRDRVKEGIVSDALFRGCFPNCRKLIAGLDIKDKKAKVPKGFKINEAKYEEGKAGKIQDLVRESLTKNCDGVISVEVEEYVFGEKSDGIKRHVDFIRLMIRTGNMKPMSEDEINTLALELKEQAENEEEQAEE